MKAIRAFVVFLLALMPVLASAQNSKLLKDYYTIFELSHDEGNVRITVFSLPENGQDHYFLSLGNMGHGNEVIQIYIDPVSELFIPLGETLAEAQAKLEEIRSLARKPVGESMEIIGNFAVAIPTNEPETITVTHVRPILGHKLEFTIRRENYILATHVSKSDFGSIVSGVKVYRKIHPNKP